MTIASIFEIWKNNKIEYHVHKLAHYYGKKACRPCVMRAGQLHDFARACLAHRPMTVVIDLGTRLHYAHTYKIRKWRLRNGHQPGSVVNSVVNSIIDLKTPSGRWAPHFDKRQFSSEIAVSSPTVFRDITVEHCGRNKKARKTKNGTFATAHFFISLFSGRLLGNYKSLADDKGTQRRSLGV